jgi:hypothetical protein
MYAEYGSGNRKGCPYKSYWEDLQVKRSCPADGGAQQGNENQPDSDVSA